MMRWFKGFVATSDDTLTQVRGRFLQALAVISMVVGAAGLVAQIIAGSSVIGLIFTTAFMLINVVVLWLVSRRLVNLAAFVVVNLLILTAISNASAFLVLALLGLISAAALTGRTIYLLANLLIFGRYFIHLGQLIAANSAGVEAVSNEMVIGLSLMLVSISTRYFVVSMERSITETRRNAGLLSATAEVGQIATSILDLNELFSRSVEMIRERFGFYHVQIFMVNGDQAELVASTGEVGRRLLANKHKLPIGSNSVIGQVTRYAEPLIARSTDAVHRFNPLLPDTRSELAVPIFEGDQVIGAIDMQSTQLEAFRPEDVQALRSMANLLAAAIRNARWFEAQQRNIQEQQRLYLESQNNLREIERLNRQLTRAGWDDFLKQSKQAAGVTLQNERITVDSQWTESLTAAASQRQIITRQANGSPGVVAVPVVLRGEVIGAIEVEPAEDTLQRDAVETVQAIAQRLATSLENARLFEEAQASTAQEQRINQIVTRYQSATTVDDLLRITLTELSEALGAQRGAIRLGLIPEDGGAAS